MKSRQATRITTNGNAIVRGGENVFADLGFSQKEARELKVKAELTLQIRQRIKALGLTQTRAAERLELSQPDVSKLVGGRHSGFSVDRLLSLLNALEVDIDIVCRPKLRRSRSARGIVRVMAVSGV